MAHIRFSIQVDTEDEEPSRVVRRSEGTVFEYEGESDTEKQIGDLRCFLVQPGLAEEKQIRLFDAMDSISDETAECYEAVFDVATNDLNADIEATDPVLGFPKLSCRRDRRRHAPMQRRTSERNPWSTD
jgi:hypothetical protein